MTFYQYERAVESIKLNKQIYIQLTTKNILLEIMSKFYGTILFVVISCCCVCILTTVLANDNYEEIIDYIWVVTVLSEQDEEYHQNMNSQSCDTFCISANSDPYGRHYKCTIVDTSSTIIDTLCGLALYYLYFDTTDLASGKELQRTEDKLFGFFRLNREVRAYSARELPDAPKEIIFTDSLLRRMLSSKIIRMKNFSPHYLFFDFHAVFVEFTIVPFCEKNGKKEE